MSFESFAALEGQVDLGLPEFVNREQIGLSLGRIGSVARMGGYNGGVEIHPYYGKTTEVSHQIVGRNSDGTAVAGKAAVRHAERGTAELGADPNDHGRSTEPPLNLRVNMSEVTRRVEHAGPVRNPKLWARELDGAISHTLRKAVWQKCRVDSEELTGSVLAPAFWSVIFGGPITEDVRNFVILSTLSRIIVEVPSFLGVSKEQRRPCLSLIPSFHPDSALVASGLTRTMRFVKPL